MQDYIPPMYVNVFYSVPLRLLLPPKIQVIFSFICREPSFFLMSWCPAVTQLSLKKFIKVLQSKQ